MWKTPLRDPIFIESLENLTHQGAKKYWYLYDSKMDFDENSEPAWFQYVVQTLHS
jgi:hypothetical protein